MNDVSYTLVSIYAPNSDQLSFLSQTFQVLDGFKQGEVWMGCDLNFICDPHMDRAHISSNSAGATSRQRRPYINANKRSGFRSKLTELFISFNLVDVWRELYPSAKQYTFCSPSHNTYTRIDYILASRSLFQSVFLADIGIRSLSDHAWVSCLFSKKL